MLKCETIKELEAKLKAERAEKRQRKKEELVHQIEEMQTKKEQQRLIENEELQTWKQFAFATLKHLQPSTKGLEVRCCKNGEQENCRFCQHSAGKKSQCERTQQNWKRLATLTCIARCVARFALEEFKRRVE